MRSGSVPLWLNRRHFLAGVASSVALAGTSACVGTNEASGRDSFIVFQSMEDDIAQGRANHPKILKAFGGIYDDRRLNGYLQDIGRRLANQTEYKIYPYHFTILNSQIVNALALPGGFIYVTRGLLSLASSEAELAGVLSHELAHVNARHGAERQSAEMVAQFGLVLGSVGLRAVGLPSELMQIGETAVLAAIKGYSRKHEYEADILGIRYMSRAGYDPDAMAAFLSSLREHSRVEARVLGLPTGSFDEFNIMSTHPRTVERVKQAQRVAAKRGGVGEWRRNKYLDQIDGMVFGDDPLQGVIRGIEFTHPILRFKFRAPTGFRLRNSPTRVTGRHPDGAIMVFDSAASRGGETVVKYLRQIWAANVQLHDVEQLRISDHNAATAWALKSGSRGHLHIRFLAIRIDSGRYYRFMFIAPREQAGRWHRPFRSSGLSYRMISELEARQVRASRLLIVSARGDDSIQGLAQTLPYGHFNADWFRVLNDLAPGQKIQKNQRLKVVAN